MIHFIDEEEHPFLFNSPVALRPVLFFNMGLAYQALGRLDEAVAAFEESVKLGKALGNVHVVAPSLGHLAEIEIIRGRLHQTCETCRRGIELVAALAGRISPLAGLLHIRLGQLFYEWNELETAVEHFQEGITLAKPWRYRDTLLPGYLGLERAYHALGQAQEAQDALVTLDELLADDLGSADSIAIAHYAWYQAEQGDLEPARRWAKSINLNLDEAPLGEAVAIIQARIRLMQGESEAAANQLRCGWLRLNLVNDGVGWADYWYCRP